MFRKLGFGSSSKSKKRPKKKRLSPAAHERTGEDGAASTGTAVIPPPSYQYAMNEYALTGPSAPMRGGPTNNMGGGGGGGANIDDEGKIRPSFSMTDAQEEQEVMAMETTMQQEQQIPLDQSQQQQQQQGQMPPPNDANVQDETITPGNVQKFINTAQVPISPPGHLPSRDGIMRASSHHTQMNNMYSPYARRRFLSPKAEYFSYDEDDTITNATFGGHFTDDDDNSTRGPSMMRRGPGGGGSIPHRGNGTVEQMMPDATYEEWYGDAYVGGPIRYIYPSGYQSMRPRGSPWKLSIVVCLLFTWLSVFIIGHCSDIYAQNQKNGNNNSNANSNDDDGNNYNNDDNYDDLVINEKWCGSILLYWMWVISMLITGIASAYCGVIGYIKVRDFAVANSRSQPPGIMMVGDFSMSGDVRGGDIRGGESGNNKGNSDYYVPIGDAANGNSRQRQHQTTPTTGKTNYRLQQTHPAHYHKTIYQADGTPQFWGNQIYRPNQAAVHIVSR